MLDIYKLEKLKPMVKQLLYNFTQEKLTKIHISELK